MIVIHQKQINIIFAFAAFALQKLGEMKWLWCGVIILSYLMFHSWAGENGYKRNISLTQNIATMEVRNANLQREIRNMEQNIALLKSNDPGMVTERARIVLGVIAPDEIMILREAPPAEQNQLNIIP